MVIIRIWWGVISILYVIQLETMHVGLEKVKGTEVVEISNALPRILA